MLIVQDVKAHVQQPVQEVQEIIKLELQVAAEVAAGVIIHHDQVHAAAEQESDQVQDLDQAALQ